MGNTQYTATQVSSWRILHQRPQKEHALLPQNLVDSTAKRAFSCSNRLRIRFPHQTQCFHRLKMDTHFGATIDFDMGKTMKQTAGCPLIPSALV